MLAMTVKGSDMVSRKPLTDSKSEVSREVSGSSTAGSCVPIHSGLSALIQAATSQLGHLAEEASAASHNPDVEKEHTKFVSVASSDDGHSSDGGEKQEHSAQTPTMVPEPDPRRQSFPELLMTLAIDPANIDIITFLPDGKFFAVRSNEFADTLMTQFFAVTTFEEFLDLSSNWGFSRIIPSRSGSTIEVFRHPKFLKGDWDRCSRIKFGESPTEVRVSALPMTDFSQQDNSDPASTHTVTKRRLSPGFLARRESETSVTSQKMKVEGTAQDRRKDSSGTESEAEGSLCSAKISKADELRAVALSITDEKMNLKGNSPDVDDNTSPRGPLVDCAVESATHTIVTDAIETLLRDENHSKKTYLKHEKELSKSSLPGVVPISKQLFSKDDGDTGSIPKAATNESTEGADNVTSVVDKTCDAISSKPLVPDEEAKVASVDIVPTDDPVR